MNGVRRKIEPGTTYARAYSRKFYLVPLFKKIYRPVDADGT
jgi:hypothetical protein